MVKILIIDGDDDFHKGLIFIPKSPFIQTDYMWKYRESQIPLGSEYF